MPRVKGAQLKERLARTYDSLPCSFPSTTLIPIYLTLHTYPHLDIPAAWRSQYHSHAHITIVRPAPPSLSIATTPVNLA